MTEEEKSYCVILTMRAGFLKQSGKHIREIMRAIAGGKVYEDDEESSED